MAAKSKSSPPRPGKNSDGQKKGKEPQAKPAPAPTGPGTTNPMSPAAKQFAPADIPNAQGVLPGKPIEQAGSSGMQEQSRQNINFRDMPPPMQMQVESQQGLDPMAPLKMLQSNVAGTTAQGPSQGPIPNELAGPGVPEGLGNFPDDLAHLHQLMQQGLGPGSTPQEHALGQNAKAIARAHVNQAEQNAQQTAQYADNVQQLGGLMHSLGQSGQLPAPQDVAAHVANTQVPAPGSAPGAYGAQPATPGQLPADVPPGPNDPRGGPYGPDQGPPQLGSNIAPPAKPPTTASGGIPPQILQAMLGQAQARKRR